MGSLMSLLCCPNELAKRGEVLVVKEDGESVRFKDGTLVKDVLSAYPYHKIIRCCSQRTVLTGETQLSCNSLYFLLPVGLALSEAAYQSLIQSAASQNLVANIPSRIRININIHAGGGGGRRDHMYNDYSCSYKWRPVLTTIPEIATPSN